MAAAPELKTLGRYNIERVLGKGAMGVVYEGVDPRLGRRVAIKTILKSHLDEDTGKDFAMRFVREAQAVARLNHPNIVQVYDFGEEGDIAYIVMEFIRGKELKTFFDASERFDLKEVVRIMVELCDALDFAHQAGIVHRDIKPANVMLDAQARTKLTDFGVARVQDSDKTSVERTQAGTMVGTPAYMSPEQITGGTIDKRTDVFSAGIILYQFLTGEKPFTGSGAWTIAKKIIQEEPPLPSSINTSVTPLFDAVVNKALAKDPEQRYQTARDLGIGLKRAFEGRAEEDDSDKTVVGAIAAPGPAQRPAPAAKLAAAPAEGTGAKGGTGSQSQQEVELEFWRAIKDGNDPDDFDLYVQQFPTGIYAALAKRKIAKLRGVAPEETGAKVKEQEKKEAEEAARREAEVKEKLEAEKARLEAEMARKEEEYKQREAAAEAKRLTAEQARAEAEAKREAEAKTRAEAEEKARREALEKAKQEAAAELAKREADYKKREAEGEAKRQAEAKARADAEAKAKAEADAKAKQDAALRAKQDAEAKVKREAEEKKARAEAEARAKAEAEAKAKREAEFAKREAELKKQLAEAEETMLPGARKKSAVVPVVIGVLVAAIGGGAWYALAPKQSGDARVAELQKQLAESKKREGELQQAKEREAKAVKELELARQREAEAKKSGDVAKQKELAEQTKLREADAKKQGELTKQREADANKQKELAEKSKTEQGKLAEAKTKREADKASAERAATDKAEGQRLAAERAAVEKASAEAKEAIARAGVEKAAAEKAAAEARAAAERAKAEQAKVASAPATAAAPASGEGLFHQAAALEQEGKGREAVKMYTQAARAGNGKAAKRLGEIYDKGLAGISRDYAESLKWYNAARVLGEDVPMAKSR